MSGCKTLLAAFVGALAVAPAALAGSGAQVWTSAGCAGCHTLAAAGATGQVGPNLDVLRPSAAAVADQVSSGGGGMPSFAGRLTQSQIEALATYVSSSAGASASASTTGMTSPAIMRLQRELATLHYFNGPVTGFYGPLTRAAVKRFQRANGLTADGLWGPRSAAALRRRLGAHG